MSWSEKQTRRMVFAAAVLYQWGSTALVKARGKDADVTEQQIIRALIKILAVGFDRNCHICNALCRTDLKYQGITRLWKTIGMVIGLSVKCKHFLV